MCGHCTSSGGAVVTATPTTGQTGASKTAAASACSKSDHKSCARYKPYKTKYCKSGWVSKNCRQMCGTCSTKKTTAAATKKTSAGKTCTKKDHKACSRYAKQKGTYCQKSWIKKNCESMCGFCKAKAARKPSTNNASNTKLPVCTTADHKSCSRYEKWATSYCARGGWVKSNCKLMCKQCRQK